MKYLYVGLAIFIFSLSFSFLKTNDIIEEIISTLEKGDASSLVAFFQDDLEVIFDGGKEIGIDDGINQEFNYLFEQNPPKKFKLKHQGETRDKSSIYFIGILFTEGKDIRFTIGLKNKKIQTMEIEFVNGDDLFSKSRDFKSKI